MAPMKRPAADRQAQELQGMIAKVAGSVHAQQAGVQARAPVEPEGPQGWIPEGVDVYRMGRPTT